MARNFGVFNFSNNLEVKKDAALDPRLVVDNVADLTLAATWDSGDGKAWLYNGMVVSVCNEGKLFMLTNFDMETAPDAYKTKSNWIEVDASAAKINVINNLESTSTVDPLSAAQGKVLKDSIDEVDSKLDILKTNLGGALTYQGSKVTFEDLPTDATKGDVWNVEAAHDSIPAGTNYAFDGENWDALGGSIDLSNYYTSEQTDNKISAAVNGVVAGDLGEALGTVNTSIENLQTTLSDHTDKLAVIQGNGEGSINKAIDDLESKIKGNLDLKVDKVDGSSLITEEKLALIDTNEANIEELKTKVETNTATLNVLVGDDSSKSVRSIANEVVTELLEWQEVE